MAVEKITMPQLGESVTEGTISRWIVSVGDKVNKYDPLAEVMTDKVNAEIPSSFTGTIKELVAEDGDTLAVGEIICYIETEGSGETEATAEAPKEKSAPASAPAAKSQAPSAPATQEDADAPNKRRYSPAVLRLAQENNVDLEQVKGSGAGGRITRKDIQAVIDSGNIPTADSKPAATQAPASEAPKAASAAPAAPSAPAAASAPKATTQPVNVPVEAGDIEIPVTGVRKAIAANMLRSKHEAPHAWTMIEVDATNLVEYRNSLKGEFKKKRRLQPYFLRILRKSGSASFERIPTNQLHVGWR